MTNTPRWIALEILDKVEKKGAHADQILGKRFKRRPELIPREKAFITELVYGVLRWRDTLDWIIKECPTHPRRPMSRLLRSLLRLGVYQVLYLTQIPVPVSVSETVALAKERLNDKMGGLVNGILRNLARNRGKIKFPLLEADPIKAVAVQYSHPPWLVEKWVNQYGIKETISLCLADNNPPLLIIRANTLKTTRKKLIAALDKEGLTAEATRYSSEGLTVYHPADITRLDSFKQGWFLVQDEAAQMISYLLNPRPGELVLDLCAAPGGKTTHLAQIMNNEGRIIAIDVRLKNLLLVQENQVRLGITIIKPLLADGAKPLPLEKKLRFDKVLLDVPCSGLGILRRHPDGKWRKSLKTLNQLKRTQQKILRNASGYVKPGGVLVYSTCTLNAEENEKVIEDFLAGPGKKFKIENPLSLLPSQCKGLITSEGFFQSFPHRDGMDGFFGARLRRESKKY